MIGLACDENRAVFFYILCVSDKNKMSFDIFFPSKFSSLFFVIALSSITICPREI